MQLTSNVRQHNYVMPDFDFDEYLSAAQDELQEKQERLNAEFGLGTWSRFVVDFEAGNLQFFEHEALRAHAEIVPVATHVPEKKA